MRLDWWFRLTQLQDPIIRADGKPHDRIEVVLVLTAKESADLYERGPGEVRRRMVHAAAASAHALGLIDEQDALSALENRRLRIRRATQRATPSEIPDSPDSWLERWGKEL